MIEMALIDRAAKRSILFFIGMELMVCKGIKFFITLGFSLGVPVGFPFERPQVKTWGYKV
jgi:hypothetical protein